MHDPVALSRIAHRAWLALLLAGIGCDSAAGPAGLVGTTWRLTTVNGMHPPAVTFTSPTGYSTGVDSSRLTFVNDSVVQWRFTMWIQDDAAAPPTRSPYSQDAPTRYEIQGTTFRFYQYSDGWMTGALGDGVLEVPFIAGDNITTWRYVRQ